jgi:hypothetical protein
VTWALCYQGTLLEIWQNVGEVILGRKFFDILEKLILWDTDEGIFDPAPVRKEGIGRSVSLTRQ